MFLCFFSRCLSFFCLFFVDLEDSRLDEVLVFLFDKKEKWRIVLGLVFGFEVSFQDLDTRLFLGVYVIKPQREIGYLS